MKTKVFENQVSEITENVKTAKSVSKSNASSQLEASAKRENMKVKELSPREIWAKFEADNAIQIAEKVVSKSGAKYAFNEVKTLLKDFTIILTSSDKETSLFELIDGKSIYCKPIDNNTIDNVLRSYESAKLHFEALRIEANKQQREKANINKNAEKVANNDLMLIKAVAIAKGISEEEAKTLLGL